MGLSVEVGMLADLLENDEEGAEWFRDSIEAVNAVLLENNLPPHREPDQLPPHENRTLVGSYPYSFLHFLRRVAAHVAENPGWIAIPFPESSDPTEDPILSKQMSRMKSHLLCHSDCEGFYVPIDFAEVIVDKDDRLPGGMLGSSFALMNELVSIAPALGVRLEDGQLGDDEVRRIDESINAEAPLWIEKAVWQSFFEAARISLQFGTAISFT
jgi:hypothetical protein